MIKKSNKLVFENNVNFLNARQKQIHLNFSTREDFYIFLFHFVVEYLILQSILPGLVFIKRDDTFQEDYFYFFLNNRI